MRQDDISEETLRYLYYEQGLTQDQIAEELGCSQPTIYRRMAELGLEARPSHPPLPEHLVPPHVLADWSPSLAYVVGLVTTDGCLKSDQPNVIDFSSTELELINLYQNCLGIAAHIIRVRQRTGSELLSVKISDRNYRAFLEYIGLTPAKSLTLGALSIPAPVFPDFLRGCIDGDGSIWLTHVQERMLLGIQIASGSLDFLSWIRQLVAQFTGLDGHIYERPNRWDLRFNGRYAVALGQWIYYDADVPCLSRKRAVWETYCAMHGESG